MEANPQAENPNWPMFEHSYYQSERDGVPEVPADNRKGVFTELLEFVGYRYEESMKDRCLNSKCHYCLEHDFELLGLDAKWTGFVYEYHTGKKYSRFRAESIELNDKLAADAAVELVNTFKAALSEIRRTMPEDTPMVYHHERPFGYDGHAPETFIQTMREGFNSIGIQAITMDELLAEDNTKH